MPPTNHMLTLSFQARGPPQGAPALPGAGQLQDIVDMTLLQLLVMSPLLLLNYELLESRDLGLPRGRHSINVFYRDFDFFPL